ncbi:MAG: hypothetical protein PVH87_20365 [Desulfobacteraceae bacterium]
MIPNMIKYATLMMATILMAATMNAHAGDFDDGIEIDDKIEKYDTLGQPGINTQYIMRSAKASADNSIKSVKGNGDIAIGSFINQPGAKVGNVTIIFNGEDINAISE